MPSDGKLQSHRGDCGRLRGDRIRVRYTPRPHITVYIKNRAFNALLDTGSELSFLNETTAALMRRMGFSSTTQKSQVQLADGATASIPGTVRLPIRVGNRTHTHRLFI